MKRLALLPLLFVAACSNNPQPKNEAQTALPPASVDAATAGTIAGRVSFEGPAPVMPAVDFSANPQCERAHKTPFKAETVVVNSNKTLRNVFVWIKDGLPQVRWTPPAESVKLDQSGCVYEPHVTGLMVGQQLEILNGDPVNHNIHGESKVNPAWNKSQPPRAEHEFMRFDAQEILFPVTCGVHPWMRSYIGVSPHPYFAVTGSDGTFTLKNVPPGTYTIEAVHEMYGRKEGKVTVAPNGAATLDFSYGA